MNEILYESLDNPYVHSNIWNFTENQVRGSFLDRGNEEEYKRRIGAEIDNLKKISNQLREETQRFLGARNTSDAAIEEKLREIAQSIGDDNLRYIKAMNKILRSKDFQYSKKLSDRVKVIEGEIVKRYVCDFGITLDERIADGVYFAKSINLLEYILNDPKLLEGKVNDKIVISRDK